MNFELKMKLRQRAVRWRMKRAKRSLPTLIKVVS